MGKGGEGEKERGVLMLWAGEGRSWRREEGGGGALIGEDRKRS